MDEMTTFTWQSPPFPLQSHSSYTVKNAQTKHISILSALSTSVTIAIDKHQDIEYLTAMEFEAGDFNHSGGYCYKLLFFSDTCSPCFSLSLFIYDRTDIYHKANMPFTYACLILTLCMTCVHLMANTFLLPI